MLIRDLNLHEKYAGVTIDYAQDLTFYSTLQLKGTGDIITISELESLPRVLSELSKREITYRIIGKGSNILIDEDSKDPYIKINFEFDKNVLNSEEDFFYVPASVSLNTLTAAAIKNGFRGWEVFTGIPASLGGAIAMNAGTSLGEISTIVEEVIIVKGDGDVITKKISNEDFSYRQNHFLKEGEIIVGAKLIHHGVSPQISLIIKKYLQKRSENQPLTMKTCGCTFKNKLLIKGKKGTACRAGEFIDMIGLKGLRYKNLRVSPVHANFIENMGGATKKEFLEFIEIINNEVDKNAGFKFETEVVSFI